MITTPTQQPTQQASRQTMNPLLALCLGYFMTILDVTIVNIALVDIVALCQTFTFTGFIFVISLFLQQVKHYSSSLTGLALLPSFGCALLATSLSGTFMARVGAKRVMVVGLLLAALGCLGLAIYNEARQSPQAWDTMFRHLARDPHAH